MQIAAAQVCFRKVGPYHYGAMQVRVAQICLAQKAVGKLCRGEAGTRERRGIQQPAVGAGLGLLQIAGLRHQQLPLPKVGTAEIGSRQTRVSHLHPAQIGPHQPHLPHVGVRQFGEERCTTEVGLPQHAAREVGSRQVGVAEAPSAQVEVGQVAEASCWSKITARDFTSTGAPRPGCFTWCGGIRHPRQRCPGRTGGGTRFRSCAPRRARRQYRCAGRPA